jgi:hypothetical protein
MFDILKSFVSTLCSTLRNRRDLALENLAVPRQNPIEPFRQTLRVAA